MARAIARDWLILRLVSGFLRRAVSLVSPSTVGLLVPLDWAGLFVWGFCAYRRGRGCGQHRRGQGTQQERVDG